MSFYNSRTSADGAAQSAVPAAARASAISEIMELPFCPSDCPYPNPYSITYTITSVTTSLHVFVNIIFGWFERLFGKGWYYAGTAHYNWTATAACARKYPEFKLIGVEVVPPGG